MPAKKNLAANGPALTVRSVHRWTPGAVVNRGGYTFSNQALIQTFR